MRWKSRPMPGSEWRRLHSEAVVFLNETVQAGDVVITHYAPSHEGRDTEMQRNIRKLVFSSAYASSFDDRIEAWVVELDDYEPKLQP